MNQNAEENYEESDEKIELLKKMDMIFNKMTRYEDKKLQAKALGLIHKVEFYNDFCKERAKRESSTKSEGELMDGLQRADELMLAALLKWFKTSFFQWVDKPECTTCLGPTVLVGELPSYDNSISRIEEYMCDKCSQDVLFPRYEDPEILLQTRKGRCGEWANCFMLLCRALSWDVRYVYDVTDHVWTEVYSERQKRWLHCDPCEAALDTPLMYEKGWGKKLSYVLAFSIDGVQDVTWRYSSQHQEILNRRKAVPEQELIKKILSLSKKRQSLFSPEQNQEFLRRRIAELVEFLTPPKSTEEYGGRISGSDEWKNERGESASRKIIPRYVWKASPAAIQNSKFEMKYSTSLDKYVENSSDINLMGWESGVYSAEAIFRKEELDWKTAYLARVEGSAVGKIEWKFNFEKCGMIIDHINLNCPYTLYENATVEWFLCDETNMSESRIFDGEKTDFVTVQPDINASLFTLRAELKYGKGNVAWQHAQLFRQSTNSSDFIFSVAFIFQPKEEPTLHKEIP